MKSVKNKIKNAILYAALAILIGFVSIIVFASVKTAIADEPNAVEAPLPMPTNVSYSTIYYGGSKFVVFSNSTGSDIEVIQIQ